MNSSQHFEINKTADWGELRAIGADVVVDPVVVRTAHQFVLGKSNTANPARVWKALEEDIGALAAFVDALVLQTRIPIFNYEISWDPSDYGIGGPDRPPEPFELLEACGDVLVPVHISLSRTFAPEYDDMVGLAAEQVGWHPQLPPTLAREIAEQLAAYEYSWEPAKGREPSTFNSVDFESFSGPDTDSGRVLRYLRGYLVFSGFAQLLGADHLVPPGWSRLYAAASLPFEPDDEALRTEAELFARLAAAGNADPAGLGRTVEFSQPTFLPYLLDDPQIKTPADLFRKAIDLRQESSVISYVKFRRRVREELIAGHAGAYLREIEELAASVRHTVNKTPRTWPVTLRAALSAPGGPTVGAEASKTVDLWVPVAWSLRQLPGNEYRKLLLRLVIAQHETSLLRGLIRTRWEAV